MSYCRMCKLEYGTEPNLIFHRIPKNETMRIKWMDIIGKVVPVSTAICSKHFSDDQYDRNYLGEKKRLKSDAFPNINLTLTDNLLPAATSNSSNLSHTQVSQPIPIPTQLNSSEANDFIDSIDLASFDNTDDDKESCEHVAPDDHLYSLESGIILDAGNRNIAEEPNTRNLKQRRIEQNIILESELLGKEERTPLLSQPAVQEGQRKLPKPRFLGDFKAEHFVRKEDFQDIQRCLKQQRLTADKQKKRVKRWKNQVVEVKSLLSELNNEGLLSSEAADKIRASLPSLIYEPSLREAVPLDAQNDSFLMTFFKGD